MKAISAVIAVVLILMITVALAAAAYVWFSDVFGSITEDVGEAAEGVSEKISTDFDIEAVTWGNIDYTQGFVNVSLRNIGTTEIDITKLAVYISGEKQDVNYMESDVLAPGEVVSIGLQNKTVACSKVLKVTTATGLEKSETIVC